MLTNRNTIADPSARRRFVLGGNATFTVVSGKTGRRFTYRVRVPKNKTNPHFVQLMSGPDNECSFGFLGTIFDETRYVHGRKSRISPDHPAAAGFAWLWARLKVDAELGGNEFWHEGRCGCCGRKLTVPSSIESGIGPICAGR